MVSVVRDNSLHLTPLAHFNLPPPLSLVQSQFSGSIVRFTMAHNSALVEDIFGDLYLVQFMFPETVRSLKISRSVFGLEDQESGKYIFLLDYLGEN